MPKFFFSRLVTSRSALLLLGVMAVFGPSAAYAMDVLRVTVPGFKLGDETGIRKLSELPGLSVTPASGVVYSNSVIEAQNQLAIVAKIPFGYKLSHWVRAFDDSFSRKTGELVSDSEGQTELTVRYETGGACMYLAPVILYDNDRILTVRKSPFGAGEVVVRSGDTEYGVISDTVKVKTFSCQKGDQFHLKALARQDKDVEFAHSTFRRWNDGVTDYERWVDIDSNDTYVAEFVPNSWDVTFDANGGEVFPTSKVVTCDATYGWLPTPTLTGSEFKGWTLERTSGMTISGSSVVGAIGDHTLFAQWDKLRFQITGLVTEKSQNRGRVNGGGEYSYGSTATLTADPNEGWQFERWTDGSTDSPRRIQVVSNATYVAEFGVRQCSVVFNYRNSAGQLASVTRQVTYGNKAEPPSEEEYDRWPEHKFTSWDKDDWQKVTRDLTVTALYDMETFDVRFAYRGSDGSCVTTMPQHVETGKAAKEPDRSVIDNWPGMSFNGWDRDFSVVRSDLLVTAIYTTNRYTIVFSYNNDNGKEVQHTEQVFHGETIPFDYVGDMVNLWHGHEFKYWSMDGLRIDGDIVATRDSKIVAVYEGYSTIVFNPGVGGEGEMPTLAFTNFTGTVMLPSNAFTRTGYQFDRWLQQTATATIHYGNCDSIHIDEGENISLTAQWTPIEYVVEFDVNGGIVKQELTPVLAHYDEPFSIPPFPFFFEREGYEFQGWRLDKGGNGEIYKANDVVKNLTNEAATVVLYAQWKEKNKSKIEVKTTGDGKGTVIGGGLYYDGTNAVLKAIPDTGSRFVSWQDGDANATRTVAVASNVTYAARFDLLRYDVVFAYTNSLETATNFLVKGVAYGTAANPPSEEEYDRVPGRTFVGWSTEAYTNVVSDLNISARYTNLLYVVACEASGDGHGTVAGTNIYEWGATPQLKAIPSEGCEFQGWSDGVTAAERTIVVTSNVTYGAVFARKRYQVKFSFRDANGKATNEIQTVLHGEPATAPDAAGLWPDHEFKGWVPSDFTRVTNNMTITASYDSFAVVIYWPNGGTGEKKTISYPPDQAATFESNDYTRVGYSFTGWAAGAKEYDDGAEIPVAFLTTGKTTDVYAVWSSISYTLKFDANGGQGAPGDIGCTYDQAVTIPNEEPQMTGYNFLYWARESTGDSSVAYQPGEVYSNLTAVANDTVTLYARWNAQPPCKIVYHANDGTGNTTTQVVAIAEASSAKFAAGPSREGYEFSGWTNVNSTVGYTAGNQVPGDYITAGASIDFFASWVKEESPLKAALGLGGTDVEVSAPAGGWTAAENGEYAICEGGEEKKLTLTFKSKTTLVFSAMKTTNSGGTLQWTKTGTSIEYSITLNEKNVWKTYASDMLFAAGDVATLSTDKPMHVKLVPKE